jgi:hypothetical protein
MAMPRMAMPKMAIPRMTMPRTLPRRPQHQAAKKTLQLKRVQIRAPRLK